MVYLKEVVQWIVEEFAENFNPEISFDKYLEKFHNKFSYIQGETDVISGETKVEEELKKLEGLLKVTLYHRINSIINGERSEDRLRRAEHLKNIENMNEYKKVFFNWQKLLSEELLKWYDITEMTSHLDEIKTFADLVDAVVDRQIRGKRDPVLFRRKEAPETPKKEPAPGDESWYHGPLLKFKKGAKGLGGAIADSCRWVQDKYVAADKYLTRRVGGTYAFTWWKVTKKDAEKLLNGHYYPRFRGDMKAGFTEIPNKKIERFLMGQEKNFGKFEGQVDGEYLGWMGLTEKGWIGAKEEGQIVPQFTTGEDEVVMLGVAHLLRFDLMRLKFNGVNGWKFDWGELTWKWDIWDPAKGSDAPGPIKVRVLLWDNDKDDGKDARSYLEKTYHMPLEYEDVIESHQEFIKNNFDRLFSLPDAGVKTEVAVFGDNKESLGTKETDNKGLTEFTAFQPGLMIETVAGGGNYVGIRINEEKYASHAPALYFIDKETSEISPKTHLKHRYITTVRKKDPVKRVLIIVQKKEKTLEDTEIVLMPATDGDKHKEPLKGPYGCDKERSFTGPVEGNDFVFHITKTKNTKAVLNDHFSYYLFLAKRNGETYLEVPHKGVQDAEVTILYRGVPFNNKNGLYRLIGREKGGKHYWTTGGGNEVIVPNFTPTLDAGVYRLYCVAIKGTVLAEDWMPPAEMLKKQPGDCTRLNDGFWDFNYIEFSYKLGMSPAAAAKEEKNALDDFERVINKLRDEEVDNLHKLTWIKKDEFTLLVDFYNATRKVLTKENFKAMSPGDQKHFLELWHLVRYMISRRDIKAIAGKRDELSKMLHEKLEKNTAMENSLKNITSKDLAEGLDWLLAKVKEMYEGDS